MGSSFNFRRRFKLHRGGINCNMYILGGQRRRRWDHRSRCWLVRLFSCLFQSWLAVLSLNGLQVANGLSHRLTTCDYALTQRRRRLAVGLWIVSRQCCCGRRWGLYIRGHCYKRTASLWLVYFVCFFLSSSLFLLQICCRFTACLRRGGGQSHFQWLRRNCTLGRVEWIQPSSNRN